MDTKDTEFLKRIMATFRIEAEEHVKSFSNGLIELEKLQSNEINAGIIELLFREVHSLKGAARSVGQKEIESVCQPLESLFSALKRGEATLIPEMFDLFHQNVDLLSRLIIADAPEQLSAERQNIREIIQKIRQIAPDASKSSTLGTIQTPIETVPLTAPLEKIPEPTEPVDIQKITKKASAEVVRIPISKLDPLLRQAEEFSQASISLNQQTSELLDVLQEVANWKMEWMNWRGRRKSVSIGQWIDWQENNELRLIHFETQLAKIVHGMERDRYSNERLVNDHLNSMKQVLMLPVSSMVEVFPAMVREISREQLKEIEFSIEGAELEIDKRILEEIKDPLLHLIRNSIDHGIGTPEERQSVNKPAKGKINLSFEAKENGWFEITLSDDGKGISTDLVLKAAIKSDSILTEAAQKLTKKEDILSLIYQSGVSTSPIITDLSGRGLGLSIVREKVEKLNGKISLESNVGIGTTFRILLPMNLAAFRGIVVSVGDSRFIVPTSNVERVIRMKVEDIKPVENHETIRIADDILSVVDMAQVLGIPEKPNNGSRITKNEFQGSDIQCMIILISGETRIAFKVDEVLDEHQVLVKSLGKLLNRVKNISGVTILGTGKIVPVLHIGDLMKSAVQNAGKRAENQIVGKSIVKKNKILVAEDSITSRTLLKNILETAGYLVTTAVDGADAFSRAKIGEFDLVVSDVDMPRMNGFELTAKIKNDPKLSEIPVVLVTSLESRDDRERGIDAGADAYIIKSRFDQGNLLEVIKKLI